MTEFETSFKRYAEHMELVLDQLLVFGARPERKLLDAMRYSTLGGGKRVRPFLVMASANLFNVDKIFVDRVAAAIEMVHCYSLIHDDLPSMDNDELRRGKPTCHKKYDEATAILAGDALLTRAFSILAHPDTHPDSEVRSNLCLILADAAGDRGMVGGQMIDLLAEEKELNLKDISNLQLMKTGQLIMAACHLGCILGKANKDQFNRLKFYSKNLGLAFQIMDDLLDLEGNEKDMGKKTGKDQGQGKATFASILGIEEARGEAHNLVRSAIAELQDFGNEAELLRNLAEFVLFRKS